MKGAALVPTLGIFLATLGCGGGSSTNSGVTQVSLAQSLSSLSLGNAAVGTTSASQNVSLTAMGGSVTVTSITIQKPFQMASVSLPLTLGSNQSLTLGVTFSPTAPGLVTLTNGLSIESNATNSPNTVSLSGTGTTNGGSSACTGNPILQSQTNVTSTVINGFPWGLAQGVTVTQITNSPNGNFITYFDMPAYSSLVNQIVYNYAPTPASAQVVMANIDGTNPQEISISGSLQGKQVGVTNDGKFAFYEGQNADGTADLWLVQLNATGACAPFNASNQHMTFPATLPSALVIGTSQTAADGHNVIPFGNNSQLLTVEDNGTNFRSIALGDSENADVFHRMRSNPIFPNILWYKRDQPAPNSSGTAQPEIWVADISKPNVVYNASIDNTGAAVAGDHNTWSKDGTTISFHYLGFEYKTTVLNANGTWALNGAGTGFNPSVLVGPPVVSGLTVDYCGFAPDASQYICAKAGGSALPISIIFTMSLDGQTTAELANGNSGTSSTFQGLPKPQYLDLQHILYASDIDGTVAPQLYEVTGFK